MAMLTEDKGVRWGREGAVATILADSPPLNVLGSKGFADLERCLDEIAADQGIRAVVVTGTGDRVFIAGADVKEFPALFQSGSAETLSRKVHRILDKLSRLPQPTIAALNGLTLGGGCELALACDMRIAEEHVRIGLPEIKLGIFPAGGGTQRLPRLIGAARAKELMFLGEWVDAQTALSMGLVNRIVPVGLARQVAVEMASHMAEFSGEALMMIKQAVDTGLEHGLSAGMEAESRLFAELSLGADAQEGVRAFLEKRIPNFNRGGHPIV